MTIDELVKEASRLDPNLVIEIHDGTFYKTGAPPTRDVVASVHPRAGTRQDANAGSFEDIAIKMSRETVVQVIPAKTTLFWQADPLVRALESARIRDREG